MHNCRVINDLFLLFIGSFIFKFLPTWIMNKIKRLNHYCCGIGYHIVGSVFWMQLICFIERCPLVYIIRVKRRRKVKENPWTWNEIKKCSVLWKLSEFYCPLFIVGFLQSTVFHLWHYQLILQWLKSLMLWYMCNSMVRTHLKCHHQRENTKNSSNEEEVISRIVLTCTTCTWEHEWKPMT